MSIGYLCKLSVALVAGHEGCAKRSLRTPAGRLLELLPFVVIGLGGALLHCTTFVIHRRRRRRRRRRRVAQKQLTSGLLPTTHTHKILYT